MLAGLYNSAHCQLALTVAVVAHVDGTVYERLGSDSHVTAPFEATLMNLYVNVVPAGRFTETLHRGLLVVYPLAESAIALAVFQLPSCEMDPTILMVWPYTVVTTSLKVTATVAAIAQEVEEVAGGVVAVPVAVPAEGGTEVVAVPVPGVWLAGNVGVEAWE